MRSETSSFRMGHLAMTHTKLPKEIDLWVMGYITPVYRGLYIYPMTHRTLFSPSPRALPMQRPIANGTRQKPAFVPGRKAGCLRQSGQSGGRGQRRAPRNTQRILASSGLVYISTRRLVFLSSVLLVFRAAHAAVVPSVPPKTVRRNSNRGCRRFA